MKTYLLFCLLCCALYMIACTKPYLPPGEQLVPVNACKTFPVSGTEINCCLDSVITDSRCPTGVECVWQGIVVARFTATVSNTSYTFELADWNSSQFAYRKDTVVAGFRFELLDVLPRPVNDRLTSYKTYVAKLAVSKN